MFTSLFADVGNLPCFIAFSVLFIQSNTAVRPIIKAMHEAVYCLQVFH